MKAIYLDTFAGISGNMFLGALLDAGFPFEVLENELKKLNLGEYELVYQNANKLGIEAKYFNVLLPEEHEHHHEHEHEHSHEHHHEHEHEHSHEHHHEHEHEHSHEHHHAHEHHHDHELKDHRQYFNEPMDVAEISEHNNDHALTENPHAHHHHEHEHTPDHTHEHEHSHEHHHEHAHEHSHEHHEHAHEHSHEHHHEHAHAKEVLPHTHHHHEHRNLKDIMNIINASSLSSSIKEKAEAVFHTIAVAEGKVHGKPLDEVHFHEVGAIDTIIDIVGTLLGLEYLGIEKIYVGSIVTGFGTVMCAHGLMPVPAPATAEILQGLPQQKGIVAKEMTTPTGAALMKTLATVSLELPATFKSEKIAYGAGTRDVAIPNVLRMYLGEDDNVGDDLVEVACNIDDMTGEMFGYAMEKLRQAGALDVWAEPIIMKKSRPAYKLCMLCTNDKLEDLLELVFVETSTLGVRYHKVGRQELERSFITVNLPEGTIKVKCGSYKGRVVNMAPEYEDCVQAAKASGNSLNAIMNEAREAAEASV